MKRKITIGNKELLIKFGNKRGRPKKTLWSTSQNFLVHLRRVYSDNRFTGNKSSRVLRRVFEVNKIKEAFGLSLALMALCSIFLNQPISAFSQTSQTEPVYAVNEVEVTTKRSINRPLDSFQVSQGYHFFHPAVDLKESLGAPVYAISQGRIKETVHSQFGYGNYVVIEHPQEMISLYAHLREIKVENGQEVDENTVIGTIGVSGWSTGPHLHLEIRENGRPVNPLNYLE